MNREGVPDEIQTFGFPSLSKPKENPNLFLRYLIFKEFDTKKFGFYFLLLH